MNQQNLLKILEALASIREEYYLDLEELQYIAEKHMTEEECVEELGLTSIQLLEDLKDEREIKSMLEEVVARIEQFTLKR